MTTFFGNLEGKSMKIYNLKAQSWGVITNDDLHLRELKTNGVQKREGNLFKYFPDIDCLAVNLKIYKHHLLWLARLHLFLFLSKMILI